VISSTEMSERSEQEEDRDLLHEVPDLHEGLAEHVVETRHAQARHVDEQVGRLPGTSRASTVPTPTKITRSAAK
jgi:hypothetical protein